jgi:hypothetical protein
MDTRLEQAMAAAVSPPVKAFLSIEVSIRYLRVARRENIGGASFVPLRDSCRTLIPAERTAGIG